MKSQVLHTVWCIISGKAAGEIDHPWEWTQSKIRWPYWLIIWKCQREMDCFYTNMPCLYSQYTRESCSCEPRSVRILERKPQLTTSDLELSSKVSKTMYRTKCHLSSPAIRTSPQNQLRHFRVFAWPFPPLLNRNVWPLGRVPDQGQWLRGKGQDKDKPKWVRYWVPSLLPCGYLPPTEIGLAPKHLRFVWISKRETRI